MSIPNTKVCSKEVQLRQVPLYVIYHQNKVASVSACALNRLREYIHV